MLRAGALCPRGGPSTGGVEPASFALRTVLVGQGRAPGQSSDGTGEVLYLGGDHEELAGRALGHLGERPEVEEAERLGAEVRALEPLEERTGHLDLGALDVAVGLGLPLRPEDGCLAFALDRKSVV